MRQERINRRILECSRIEAELLIRKGKVELEIASKRVNLEMMRNMVERKRNTVAEMKQGKAHSLEPLVDMELVAAGVGVQQTGAGQTDQIEGDAIQEGDGDLGEIDDQEGTEGGKDEGHWVDGFLFKSYTHAEDMPAMEPVLTFEEGEFGFECLIPVVSELGAFYSVS